MSQEFKSLNQEDPRNTEYNQKGGIIVVPGSPTAREYEKWEQFNSKWGQNPGNPYKYREFPRMLYKADRINGKPFVMFPDPVAYDYPTRDAFKAAMERKKSFDRNCQMIVKDESEMSRAVEAGWRPTVEEAIAHALKRDEAVSTATAEREYADRNASEAAQREIRAAKEAVGNEHLPEIPEKPIRRRGRPKGSKNKPKE